MMMSICLDKFEETIKRNNRIPINKQKEVQSVSYKKGEEKFKI